MLSLLFTTTLVTTPPQEDVALRWSAPAEGCPTAAQVLSKLPPIQKEVEYDHFSVEVKRSVAGWTASVDGPDTRVLEGATCEELADAVTLLVELSMREAEAAAVDAEPTVANGTAEEDPAATATEPPGASPVDPIVEAEQAPRGPAEPATTRRARRQSDRQATRWAVAASGGVGLGMTPSAAGGFELFTGLRGRQWSADLGAIGRPRFAGSDLGRTDVGSSFSIWSAVIRGCGAPGRRRVEVPLCGGFELGALTGRGTGNIDPARTATAPWVAARLDAGLRVAAHELIYPYASVGGVALLAQPSFSIDGLGPVWNAAPLGFVANLGLELRLPAKKRSGGH